MGRMFANRPGDRGSIPGCVIPKTKKIVLNVTLLKTQHFKVQIKGKVEAFLGKELHHRLLFGVSANEKGVIGLLSTTITNFIFYL